MVEEIKTLLSLPFGTVALLAGGFLAYRLAYTGKDQEHGAIDVLFFVGTYAFVAQLLGIGVAWIAQSRSVALGADLSAIMGVFFSLCFAAVWRKHGEGITFSLLRRLGVSSSKRQPSAWEVVCAQSGFGVSVLIVTKTDGTQYMSYDLKKFADLPFGGCLLGRDGSVGLYVTHSRAGVHQDWNENNVSLYSPGEFKDWGAMVTIVSADQVSDVAIRGGRQ